MMLDLQYGVTKRPEWQIDVCGYWRKSLI
jgi:hypothetical protein